MVSSGSVLKVPGQEWWEQWPGHARAMSSMEGPPLAMCPSLFFLLPEITLPARDRDCIFLVLQRYVGKALITITLERSLFHSLV